MFMASTVHRCGAWSTADRCPLVVLGGLNQVRAQRGSLTPGCATRTSSVRQTRFTPDERNRVVHFTCTSTLHPGGDRGDRGAGLDGCGFRPHRRRHHPAHGPTGRPQAGQSLTARTILDGTGHGWKGPDDLTNIGTDIYVAFQNGVPSTGGAPGTPATSTIVKFTPQGSIEQTWPITGKIDGLTADPAHHRVIATVNEDGNSSLYTVPSDGGTTPTHYAYAYMNPLPHGGGTDAITIYRGDIFVVASAPTTATGPALYHLTLTNGVAHVAGSPFTDASPATLVNNDQHTPTTLALTDPDSSTVVPAQSPRFAGSFMLDAQGDQQAIFAANLGAPGQQLQALNLSQSVDDTAFATSSGGVLLATDSTANSVVAVTGTFAPGTAYTAVTPGNANTPPTPTPANYLGRIDLHTGAVHPVPTTGQPSNPTGCSTSRRAHPPSRSGSAPTRRSGSPRSSRTRWSTPTPPGAPSPSPTTVPRSPDATPDPSPADSPPAPPPSPPQGPIPSPPPTAETPPTPAPPPPPR